MLRDIESILATALLERLKEMPTTTQWPRASSPHLRQNCFGSTSFGLETRRGWQSSTSSRPSPTARDCTPRLVSYPRLNTKGDSARESTQNNKKESTRSGELQIQDGILLPLVHHHLLGTRPWLPLIHRSIYRWLAARGQAEQSAGPMGWSADQVMAHPRASTTRA